jgi:hypothetical protein
VRKRSQKGSGPWHEMGVILDQKLMKMQSQKTLKNQSRKNMKITPKGFRNGDKIDAETHNKSMQKLVPTTMRKIINNHAFLNCKNM